MILEAPHLHKDNLIMSRSRPRQHTVLPEAQLRDYFPGNNGFAVYDIQTGKWSHRGAKTFCVSRGYYDDEHEKELSEIENAAIEPVRKIARREIPDDKERRLVAEYAVASLYRNSAMIDNSLAEAIENVKGRIPRELSIKYPGTDETRVQNLIESYANDESFLRQIRGDGARLSKAYPEIVERIDNLCWHLVHVERPPSYFLLTDHPFRYGPLGNDDEAWFGFPISSEVLLFMNNSPGKRWLTYPMKRNHVIDYGRNLVANSKARFVAAPREDAKLTKMIRRVRPVGSGPSS